MSLASTVNGLFQKRPKQDGVGGLRTWNFQEYGKNTLWKFQGSVKNEVKFSGKLKCVLNFPRGHWEPRNDVRS